MLEELIEEYLKAKQHYEKLDKLDHKSQMLPMMAAMSDFGDASERLLNFIEKHSDTLIAWERTHALRLSPFEDPE